MGFWDFLRGKRPTASPAETSPAPSPDEPPVEAKRQGPFTETFPDGGKREGTYVDGEIDGEVRNYLPTGELRSCSTYRAGTFEKLVAYHTNGAVAFETAIVDKRALGPWTKYSAAGAVVERGTMIAGGKRDGAWESWTEAGAPHEKGTYAADVRVGAWRIARPGGYAEGTFSSDGKPTGEWRSFHDDGTERLSGVFASLDELGTWERTYDVIDALAGARDVLVVANHYREPPSASPWTDAKAARERLESILDHTIDKLARDDARLPGLVDRVIASLGTFDRYGFKDFLDEPGDPRARLVRRIESDHGVWPSTTLATIIDIAHQIERLSFYEDDFPDGIHPLFEGVDYPVLRSLLLGDLEYVDEQSLLRTLNAILDAPWLANLETLDLDFWLTDDNLARLFSSPHFRVRELYLRHATIGDKAAAALRERPWAVETLMAKSGSFTRDALFALCVQTSLRSIEIEDIELPEVTAEEASRLGDKLAPTKLAISYSLCHAKCEIGEAVRRVLAMPMLRTVEELSITTEDAGSVLADELFKYPHAGVLKQLNVYSNGIDKAAHAALEKALPGVEVRV
jgi:hypothetical protein